MKILELGPTMSLAAAGTLLMLAAPASAVFTPVFGVDTPPNDVLFLPFPVMDELGDPAIFPPGEQVAHATLGVTPLIAAPLTDGGGPNFTVMIRNLQPFSFVNLHYTCNPGTTFSNVDGLINGLIAFRIDTVGLNRPLIFESMTADEIFEPGEVWHFIVDDYASAVGPPDSFFQIGVGDGPGPAAVNLIADVVPEPGSLGLLALGAVALGLRRGRRS